MDLYREHINQSFEQQHRHTIELQKWSVEHPHDFWLDLYSYLGLVPTLPPMGKAYDDGVPMSSVPPFFPGLLMNYTENILVHQDLEAPALIEIREGQDVYHDDAQVLTWKAFAERITQVASALRRSGIKKGARVAALVATSSWAVILFHATASIGAIFTSISPELGLEGCVSRLQQVSPSILFVDSHVLYKGKAVSTEQKVSRIVSALKSGPHIHVVPITSNYSHSYPALDVFLKLSNPEDALSFCRVPFNYPLTICYSSGTTGAPKCIVHQHGLIMQMKKVSMLHNCLTSKDVVLQYSSTSWIVFYGMCGNLSVGVTLILYNGSPLFPDAKQLLRICHKHEVTYLGLSPRLLLEMEMCAAVPKMEFNLSPLKTVHTTGAPLSHEQYMWFYRVFPPTVQICNIAGGTETGTALIAMDPSGPIYAGEMQICALGIDVDIVDETGKSIANTGEAGEMIVRQPFPSMPCFFWGDANGQLYKSAYFERFTTINVWAQHDWLLKNPKTGGYVMHGRSDGVLNPSGIRFGSGEIYAIIEKQPLMDYFTNSLCVGRRRPNDADEQVFLFLVMKPGVMLTKELRAQIKEAIKQGLSPRHVPKYVLAVPDIPITINGKKVEIAVKKVISGKDVKASATIQNPKSLEWFKRFRSIESEPLDCAKL
ncbi:acetyl-CoA synthetase-like protein [Cadophora sp. DSE1049]|nr:acetyl-CoA synthetase-like protein [Cadophora sp. DSE1049]